MYILKVEAAFDAAHRLPDYNGPCSRMHGHHWVVQATWKVVELSGHGMTIDLILLKKLLRHILSRYDHDNLNTVMSITPTAENLARVIFGLLRDEDHGALLDQVAVEETRDTCVIYREEPETKIPHRGD